MYLLAHFAFSTTQISPKLSKTTPKSSATPKTTPNFERLSNHPKSSFSGKPLKLSKLTVNKQRLFLPPPRQAQKPSITDSAAHLKTVTNSATRCEKSFFEKKKNFVP